MLSQWRWARSLLCPLICAGATTLAMPAIAAEVRALLVGVSSYPQLAPQLKLNGPRNDVQLLRRVLEQRGVAPDRITVLADGVAGAVEPSRANIMEHLDRLAAQAGPGDQIVISMSGHGSQQPVPANSPFEADEPDGLFEIFLPRDVSGWTGGIQGVPQAILDHEIRDRVDRMTARGAFVWAIFDSCHSATLVRGGNLGEDVRMRQVRPDELDIPAQALRDAERRASARQRRAGSSGGGNASAEPANGPGRAVYFYAAQTTELAPEMNLPLGHPERRTHGLLSFLVAQALDGGAGMTYRQLSQQVLARMGTMAGLRNTPMFGGTGLDEAVLGQPALAGRQWRFAREGTTLRLQAGLLSDLGVGAKLAILPTAFAKTEEALAYVQIGRMEWSQSELLPVAHAGKPLQSLDEIAKGAVARLVQPVPSIRMTVSTDLKRCADPCPFATLLNELKAQTGAAQAASFQWVGDGQASELHLLAQGQRLWLLPGAMRALPECQRLSGQTPANCESRLARELPSLLASQARPDGLQLQLQAALMAASKVHGLLNVVSLAAASEPASALDARVKVIRQGVQRPVALDAPSMGCRSSTRARLSGSPCLRPSDRVALTLHNKGSKPIETTVLYVDAHFGLQMLFPRQGGGNRLEPGSSLNVDDIEITDSTLGMERLILIAVEASWPQGERLDLSFLEQPSLSQTRSAATPVDQQIDQLFRDAGFADYATRGAKTPTATSSRLGMRLFSWQVQP